jgi:hypothetical protein
VVVEPATTGMAGYGKTFKNLSGWTFERKLALEQDLQADR